MVEDSCAAREREGCVVCGWFCLLVGERDF